MSPAPQVVGGELFEEEVRKKEDTGLVKAGDKASPSSVAGDKGGQAGASVVRKIIYTAWFTVDVYDVEAAGKKLAEYATGAGGYVQAVSGPVLVLRIPAEKFEEVEPLLKKMGRVDDALTRIQAQDVTEEYFDVELRLQVKKKYLESLYKLLETSGKLEEKLAVQKEIARVVEEVERLEGRLRLLANQISLATVTVTLRVATSGSKRTFRLPWDWLDGLGLEMLVP
jgi:hypothetical protein